MGLDVSHDCFSAAYSAFTRFRAELHKAAGYGKYETKFIDGDLYIESSIDFSSFEEKNFQGEWDTYPDDPLLVLLVHSDCDGIIKNEVCDHLANRIEQLLPLLPEGGQGHLARLGIRGTAVRFINGLRLASESKEDVEFA